MLKQQPVETSLLSSTYFDADDISDWARPYVQTVYQLGLMKGSGGVFRPHDQVTLKKQP
ncbi:S-layer homology domain-containing protein [Paenibacillus amylolyticus]|nr:S-layer homology domain-containing protein [Paenibacillus amylolyticus]